MTQLSPELRDHYLQTSTYTDPGLYRDRLRALPDDIRELGLMVRKSIIHRTTLAQGNTGTNADKRFGDMANVPWWRQPEDDVLPTAGAMLVELYRRDPRGFTLDRPEPARLVLTCRYVAILMATILKSKGIPARVRSGHGGYFGMPTSDDHWITQYWGDGRWVTIDVDGSLSLPEGTTFDPYDMPEDVFDFPARAWIDVREGKADPAHFYNAGGETGEMVVAWSLMYDFHCLNNDEIIYLHLPGIMVEGRYAKMPETTKAELDELARLMLKPDENFHKLRDLWETKREWRVLSGGLLP
jgi:hypothetical protein